MFAHDAVDERGDLTLAFLAHFLSALPLPAAVTDLFGEHSSFRDVLTIVDLMTDNSPAYHYVVHQHMLRGLAAGASVDDVRSRIGEGLRLDDHIAAHATASSTASSLWRALRRSFRTPPTLIWIRFAPSCTARSCAAKRPPRLTRVWLCRCLPRR